MTKKLILLTLALPLVLMICLFALTKTVGQMIDAPVTGIEIVGERVVYLNLDEGESYTLNYSVFPTSAKNKEVILSFEAVGEQTLAKMEYEMFEDGRIVLTPTSAGVAKVKLRTVDGGHEDGITVYVESDNCTGINLFAAKTSLTVGESVNLETEFIPVRPKDERLSFTSSDPSVLSVSDTGKVSAIARGTATVTVALVCDPTIFDTIDFTIENSDIFDFSANKTTGAGTAGSVSISMAAGAAVDASRFSYVVLDEAENELTHLLNVTFSVVGDKICMSYTFLDESFVGELTVRVSYAQDNGLPITKECTVVRIESFDISFSSASVLVGSTAFLSYEILPSDADVTYLRYELSSDSLSLFDYSGRLAIKGEKAGKCTVTLYFKSNKDGAEHSFDADILVAPKTFSVQEAAKTYGDENLFAIGGVNADGTPSAHKLTLSTNLKENEYGQTFSQVFSFVVKNTDKVMVDADGIIHFKDQSFAGLVSIVACFDNGSAKYESEPFHVYCVANGVDVYSYLDLLYATEHGLPAVLQADVVDDFGYRDGQVVYTEMDTTYDKAHYEMLKTQNSAFEIPKIKVLLSFKNDLYGNGHTVNAGKVAYGLDDTGALKDDAFFRGPLNFISMSEQGGMISVKGQDNICFALYEGASVRNVKLYGCTLEPDESGSIDLTDLTYTGTTVEVLGDDVDISYTRMANGRTVLRAFGDATDAAKPIHLNITNSVLSGSREFIMRVGSNCFKQGSYENSSPTLDGDGGSEYNKKYTYDNLSEAEKKAYDEKFIKTFITVKNSVFKDAGLFAVAMDSHFAGPALADGDAVAELHPSLKGLLSSWKNLAKTSYGAKLTFEDDVRMYTWKTKETVDSSSLIEIIGESRFASLMEFDVAQMIEKIATPKESGGKGYTDIITEKDGTHYVHGGIAFFGGGKNYDVFENRITDPTIGSMSKYSISFNDVDRYYLTAAAGEEPFYFCMYNKNHGISVERQLMDLASPNGDAYAPIKAK